MQSDEEKINAFIKDKTVITTYAELIRTEKLNFWSIVITYHENSGKSENAKVLFSKDTELTEYEQQIFNALREWRKDVAQRENVPSFYIAHDTHLITIAKLKIETVEDLLKIKGFGAKKVAKYGEDIIALLNSIA